MGFGFIIAGFFWLINPIFHVFDILPDFVGFFLICLGLGKLSYLHSGFSVAKDQFLRLAFVALIRVACIVFVPYTSGSALLLFSFVFGVLELMFFLPAINHFFDGLYYVGMRYESDAVFAKKTSKGGRKIKEKGTSLRNFTVVFYVLRVVWGVLPELTELQMYDHIGDVTAFDVDYTLFKPLFYAILGLSVIIVGICWFVKLARYFNAIRRETEFIARLRGVFDREIAPKTWMFMAKRMKLVQVLYIFAAVLSLCMDLERINFLPGILSASVLLAAVILLAKEVKGAYAVLPFCVGRGILSIVNLLRQKAYFIDNKFDEYAVEFWERAAEQYNSMSVWQGIESAVAAVSFVLFAVMLMKAAKKHLSETGTQHEGVQYSKKVRDAEIFRSIGIKITVNQILMVLNFAAAGLYLPLLLIFEPMGAVRSVVTVVWVLHTLYTVSCTNDALYTPLVNDER